MWANYIICTCAPRYAHHRFALFGNIHIHGSRIYFTNNIKSAVKGTSFALLVVVASTGRPFLSPCVCVCVCVAPFLLLSCIDKWLRTNENDGYVSRGVCSCVRWRVNYHDLEDPPSVSVPAFSVSSLFFSFFFSFLLFLCNLPVYTWTRAYVLLHDVHYRDEKNNGSRQHRLATQRYILPSHLANRDADSQWRRCIWMNEIERFAVRVHEFLFCVCVYVCVCVCVCGWGVCVGVCFRTVDAVSMRVCCVDTFYILYNMQRITVHI